MNYENRKAEMTVTAQELITYLAHHYGFKLTPLRQQILLILIEVNQPLGAYNLLDKLKETRKSAKPPTVYRVLEFLEKQNVIHRLSHNNTYVICKTVKPHLETSIVFTCRRCHQSTEFLDKKMIQYLKKLTSAQNIVLSDQVLEITGECQNCQ